MLVDVLLDALLDSLKLLPFLFLTYLFMEWLEHGAGEKFTNTVSKAGKFTGPVVGSILGIVPQCGFSGAAATLYAGRVIALGTLVSVFLVTSDEMLPVMISQAVSPALILKILGIKLVVGILVGLVLNLVLDAMGRTHAGFGSKHAHDGHHGNDIHQLCEAEGCDCADACDCCSGACERAAAEGCTLQAECDHEHDCEHAHEHDHDHDHGCEHDHHDHGHGHSHAHGGHVSLGHLAGAAFKHSMQITVFVFVICVILNFIVEAGLEDAIVAVTGTPYVGTVIAGILGFIPNCAISVALTQLYLDGVLAGGAMMSGLMVNAGVGLIILMRTNNDSRENLRICGLLLVVGVITGLLVDLTGIL